MNLQAKTRQLELVFTSQTERDVPKASSSRDKLQAHSRRIAGYLTMRLPQPVDLVFTDNRSTMVSFRPHDGRLAVRLHKLFRHADHQVLEWLAKYFMTDDRRASEEIDRFIAAHKEEIDQTRRRPRVRQTSGKYHDVSAILDRINRAYFGGEIDVAISWGRAPGRRRRRRGKSVSRALASYDYETRLIRVSPVLDAADVPDYMIEWVIYHEMLHHVLPVEQRRGRKLYHTRRFKSFERAFRKYEQAKAWEKDNIDRLLS